MSEKNIIDLDSWRDPERREQMRELGKWVVASSCQNEPPITPRIQSLIGALNPLETDVAWYRLLSEFDHLLKEMIRRKGLAFVQGVVDRHMEAYATHEEGERK